jgi:exopolysaccharide biosynthesis polyprenyl glycosylphosphotransferase
MLRVTDVLVVLGAVVIAQWIRFGSIPGPAAFDLLSSAVSLSVALVWSSCIAIYRAREPRILGSGPEEYRRVAAGTVFAFGAIAIWSMLTKMDLARGYVAIAMPLGLTGLLVGRRLARYIVAKKRRRGKFMTSVLVVGESDPALSLVQSLSRVPELGYKVVGFCSAGRAGMSKAEMAILDGVPEFPYDDDLAETIAACGADTVAITATERLRPQEIRDLSWQLEKLDVDLVVSPGMVGLAGPRLTMRPVADLPLIHLDKPQYEGAKRFQKSLFDVCFAALVLLAVSPVLVVAGIAVKLTSRGSVFYMSERVGLDGKPFRMIKIRTMVNDADKMLSQVAHHNEVNGGVIFKIRRDPRVTSVGRFLRRYSIDELPQFINVLRREMSVVGPRPPLPSEVQAYDERVRRRLLVRPGITGLWQVSGRSNLSWDDFVRLDLSYVENWSMVNDIIIAVKTVRAVVTGSGAY